MLVWKGGDSERALERLLSFADTATPSEPVFCITNRQKLFKAAGRSDTKRTEPNPIGMLPWDSVIWDESTSLKNPKSQVSQAACSLFSGVRNKCLLTGEPRPEKLQDLFMQMIWLNGRFMGHTNYWQWQREYFQPVGHDWVPMAGTIQKVWDAMKPYAIRITNKQANVQYIKVNKKVPVHLKPSMKARYDSLERDFGDENQYTKHAVVLYGWLSQITGGCAWFDESYRNTAKMDALLDLLQKIEGRCVVLFRYDREIWYASEMLGEAQIKHRVLTGADELEERRNCYSDFHTGQFQVLLMQTKVAKFGIDLSCADDLVRYSVPESYEDISQSEQRIFHMSQQKREKRIWDIFAVGTVDEDKMTAYQMKRVEARSFMSQVMSLTQSRRKSSK